MTCVKLMGNSVDGCSSRMNLYRVVDESGVEYSVDCLRR